MEQKLVFSNREDPELDLAAHFLALRSGDLFFDVHLAVADTSQDDGILKLPAHRALLSACSTVFSDFLQELDADGSPAVIPVRGGVRLVTMLLDYIYGVEILVSVEDRDAFLALAEELRVKVCPKRERQVATTAKPPQSASAGGMMASSEFTVEELMEKKVAKVKGALLCLVCNTKIKHKCHMRIHMEAQHVKSQFRYECPKCDRVADKRKNMYMHIRQHHSELKGLDLDKIKVSNEDQSMSKFVEEEKPKVRQEGVEVKRQRLDKEEVKREEDVEAKRQGIKREAA
jgi:hypothetical protein